MSDPARQRCYNHARREAVARCPECGRFFCRECVTEHADRMVCAPCLARITRGEAQAGSRAAALGKAAVCAASLAVAWLVFFLIGRGLLMLPASFFHDQALEDRAPWWEESGAEANGDEP